MAFLITEEVKTVRPLGHLLLSPKVRVLKIQGPYRNRYVKSVKSPYLLVLVRGHP